MKMNLYRKKHDDEDDGENDDGDEVISSVKKKNEIKENKRTRLRGANDQVIFLGPVQLG